MSKHSENIGKKTIAQTKIVATKDQLPYYVRKKKEPKQKLTKQTYLQQAKAFSEKGMLPGLGGDGTMSYDEFMDLPAKHRINKKATLGGMVQVRCSRLIWQVYVQLSNGGK